MERNDLIMVFAIIVFVCCVLLMFSSIGGLFYQNSLSPIDLSYLNNNDPRRTDHSGSPNTNDNNNTNNNNQSVDNTNDKPKDICKDISMMVVGENYKCPECYRLMTVNEAKNNLQNVLTKIHNTDMSSLDQTLMPIGLAQGNTITGTGNFGTGPSATGHVMCMRK